MASIPPLSPRPSSPQKKISNVSLGSVSDLFGPESPTCPGPPRSRASDLSMISTDSAFPVVSGALFDISGFVIDSISFCCGILSYHSEN